MDDIIFFDVKGDSSLQNLNTVIEKPEIRPRINNQNSNEQDYIVIDEPTNKKKNKKKKKNAKKNRTYINPTYDRPIIVDDDVYINVESDNSEVDDGSGNIISSNAFDILNKTQFNDYIDDDVVKDYLENCKDSDSEISKEELNDNISSNNKSNNNDDGLEIEFLNSAFAKNIIKSDVGVETEPVEMEMDLIKLLENKLPSESESSSDESSDIDNINNKNDTISVNNNNDNNNNSNNISNDKTSVSLASLINSNIKNKENKKKKKGKNNKKKNNKNTKKNDMFLRVESNDIPIIELEKAISELNKEKDLMNDQIMIHSSSSSSSNDVEVISETKSNNRNIRLRNKSTEVIEIDDNNTKNVDIISLLEGDEKSVISIDDDEKEKGNNDDDVVLIDDANKNINIISSNGEDDDVILISEEENNSEDDSSEDYSEFESDEDEDDDEDDEDNTDDEEENTENIFKSKSGKKKLLISDDDDLLYENFEGGKSSWNLDDHEILEKLKDTKFKAILNSDKSQLLRLQKKKLQKKELAQRKEYLLQKKENLKKENKRIQKVLKSKKGNKLNCSPEIFKYLKHVNTIIKEFVIDGFESIPLGTLPSELRKSVGMIAIEYNVKIKTRGSGKRKVTNLIRTSRSKIPDNWNTIVETVFSKTEAQRHSNMDVRKRNLDMAKRRGKYHNINSPKGKSNVNKPELGSKVGENANPISDSNKGFQLLQSMGWNPGESLGTDNNTGIINPIEVVVRDKSGLGASYFDQGYNQSSSSGMTSRGYVDPELDEYERDILYNTRSKSSLFKSNKNKNKKNKGKNKRFSDDNFGFGRKSSRSSLNSSRSSKIGETGGLENSPYNFVNFQKSSKLLSAE